MLSDDLPQIPMNNWDGLDADVQRVVRALEKKGFRRDMAEDLAHEAMLKLLRKVKKGEPVHKRKAWLIRTGHNEGLDKVKQSRRLVSLDAHGYHVDPKKQPCEQACASETAEMIGVVLKLLPEDLRTVFMLSIEKCKYKRIREITGLTRAQARSRIDKAKTILKSRLRHLQVPPD